MTILRKLGRSVRFWTVLLVVSAGCAIAAHVAELSWQRAYATRDVAKLLALEKSFLIRLIVPASQRVLVVAGLLIQQGDEAAAAERIVNRIRMNSPSRTDTDRDVARMYSMIAAVFENLNQPREAISSYEACLRLQDDEFPCKQAERLYRFTRKEDTEVGQAQGSKRAGDLGQELANPRQGGSPNDSQGKGSGQGTIEGGL